MKSRFSRFAENVQKEKWLLLLCFLLAFLAWQGIRKNTGFPADVSNVSVDVDLPEGWAVWEKSIHQVDIVFRGSREDLRYLNSEQLRVVVPLSNPSAGEEIQSEMQNIHTEPIKLNGRQASFKENVVPIALPQIGRVRVDPDWVSVDFVLEQHTSMQEFDDIPVRFLCASGESRQMELQPKTIKVTVKGQQQRIEQMRTADVFAYVNCADLTESTGYDLPVIINLPSGVQLVKAEPATIHIRIEN
jgi:hypothetical protein